MPRILLLIVFGLLPSVIWANVLDSLRLEKINGDKFIVHRVEPKETLYSISKRYESTIDEIYKYNESLENGLKMYDEIIIPFRTKKLSPQTKSNTFSKYHVVTTGETLYSISKKYEISVDSLKIINGLQSNYISLGDTLELGDHPDTPEISKAEPVLQDSSMYHIVQPSETLFGIARKYNLELVSLVKWNELESYDISVGQKIFLGSETIDLSEDEQDSVMINPPIESQLLDTTFVKTDNSIFRTQTIHTEGVDTIMQQGFAMRIEDTDFTTKLLALHKTAPMGSLVKVTNRMTNKEVEVRVVGELPETGLNRNVLIRLSSAAYEKLGGVDQKIPVTSAYEKED